MITSVPQMRLPTSSRDQDRILAAIDLGTNSFHMVIVRIDPALPAFSIVASEKDMVRLGDCGPRGRLKLEVMERAMTCLQRFQTIAKAHNAEQIVAVATSAVREAPNGQEFIKQIADELDLEVDLISGPEEARRIYLGVLSAMDFGVQPHVIIDIGGGSTELILGDGREPAFLSSTKVGAVRLTKEFVHSDPITYNDFSCLQAYIRGMLERATDELLGHLGNTRENGKVLRLVGTSGTIETIAIINAREKFGIEPTPLTGYELTLTDLQNFVNRLRKLSYEERLVIPGISDKRAEIILAGALILQEAMILLGLDSLMVCERSLREGVIVDWMLTHGLIDDRLSYGSTIRPRSVLKTAQKYNVNLEHGERVAAFSLSLFDQTQRILHNWGADERELLWAAAILHNSGLYVSHSAYHKHSYYLIRNGELLGYTETEVEIIANIARYHRKSTPKKKHDSYQNLSKKHRQVVDQLSPLLRLAVALDRRQIGAIAQVKTQCHWETNEFHLTLKPVHPNDNCDLELWSLDLKKDAFESEYELKLVAQLESMTSALN
ncbi:MAG: HD domain-containing protein [Microcoleaceae cyanobacterium]